MFRHCVTAGGRAGLICLAALGVFAEDGSLPVSASPASLELPAPTGRFALGTSVHVWEDTSRDEVALDPPASPRTLVAQLWYPAEAGAGSAEPTPYVDPLVDGVAREMLGQSLGSLRTHARDGAPVARAEKTYPVVLFSPGFGISRFFYTVLYEELASHGFVVVAIDHPFMNLAVLPGRGLVQPGGGYWNTFPLAGTASSLEEAKRKLDFAHEYFAADQLFVLAKLSELNGAESRAPLRGRLDLERVASVGHSAGALAPHGLMLRESPVDAVVLYDVEVDRLRAGPEIVVPVTNDVHVPVLSIRLEYAPPPEPGFERQLRQPLFDVHFEGASHLGVSDVPLLQALLQGDDAQAGAATALLRALADCTRSFLEAHVKGEDRARPWGYEPPSAVVVRTLHPSTRDPSKSSW